jgi:molybdenum cofactor cytidylyltransferase
MSDADGQSDPIPVYAIIPAAGRSVRMGQPKQLLPYGDRTILEAVIETMLASPMSGLSVVTHTDIAEELDLAEDPRFLTVINDDAQSQMLDSIRMGIDALVEALPAPADCGFCVCPGDMPGVDVASVTTCIRHFQEHPASIVVATFQAKHGHPIVFPLSLTSELSAITEGGLAELLRSHPDALSPVECETPGVAQDIDTPGDYDEAGHP